MSNASEMFNDGQAYEKLMGRWSRMVGDQFIRWIDVPAGKNWLDVGCGTGAFTEEIIAKCQPASVSGLDPSPAQIEFAKARANLGAVNLQVADAQSLPFADASFDVGVMALVIAFIPDTEKAVAELARVVREGALVATYMWEFPGGVPLTPIRRAADKLGLKGTDLPNMEASTIPVMKNLWQNAGLTNVETNTFHMEVNYKDFEDFWQVSTQPLNPLGKMIQALPAELKAKLKEETHAQLPAQPDGRIVYGCFANAVKGFKA